MHFNTFQHTIFLRIIELELRIIYRNRIRPDDAKIRSNSNSQRREAILVFSCARMSIILKWSRIVSERAKRLQSD